MAKVTVKNFREHDIVLSAMASTKSPVSIVFPGATNQIDESNKSSQQSQLIPGSIEVESDDLAAVRKDNAIAASYFEEGALRVDSDKKAAGQK